MDKKIKKGCFMQAKYLYIYEVLKKGILDGTYKVGEVFPSEPELQTQFGASRITVRHSVQMLVDEGYLQRIMGVGTIVISCKASLQLRSLISFAEENKNADAKTTTIACETNKMPATLISSILGLSKGIAVSYQERVRWKNNIPISHQRVYCPQFIGLTKQELENPDVSLYSLLEGKGYKVKEAEETIESIVADETYAKYLQVEEGSPLLFVQRVTRDTKSSVIEYAQIVYRGDMYRYKVNLTAPEVM